MTDKRLPPHLRQDRYSGFVLTDAVRPAAGLPVVPREGYRAAAYRDGDGAEVPSLAAAVTRDKLFSLWLELLEELGPVVDVVLETSHAGGDHVDLVREEIDLPVLLSHLYDFEDLLLNDGCAGVAVASAGGLAEVQFDEHKLLVVYAEDLAPFEAALRRAGVRRDDRLRLITDGPHLHSTSPAHLDEFERMAHRLGVSEPAERVSWS